MVPVKVFAVEKNFTIEKLNVNAEIEENGDVQVEETFNYSFQGSFNGIYRNLHTQGTKAYKVEEISVVDSSNISNKLIFSDAETNNTYKLIDSDGNTQIKIFNKSTDEKKLFKIKYNIIGAAVKNSNIGELNWKFYTVENQQPIKAVQFTLKLKNSTFNIDKLQCDFFNSGGQFVKNFDAEAINIKGEDLSDTLGLDVKFQTEFLKDQASINENANNIPSVINENMNNNPTPTPNVNWNTNYDNNNSDITPAVFLGIGMLVTFFIIFAASQNNKKFNEGVEKYREGYDFFKENVLSEIPGETSPVLVNYLYNEKSITSRAIPSTIYYLYKLGYYTMKKDILTKDNELRFVRNTSKQFPSSVSLNFFINWMCIYENQGSLSFKDIENSTKFSNGIMEFKRNFTEWKHCVENEVSELGYFTVIESRKVLSNYGYNERLKWLAYRKFLVENFTEEGDDKVSYINDALIYAIALEIDNRYLETISDRVSNDINYDYDFYTNFIIWEGINHNINNYSQDNINHSSSFSGDIGGSSFGGDGGGGSSSGGGGDSGAF